MKAKFYIPVLFVLCGSLLHAQRPEEIQQYINTYKAIAIEEMQRTGVPAAIKLAQGIHETQAGTSELVRKSNNHFGIKCKASWTGDKVYHDDDARGECFRSYTEPEQSYRDHSDFLKSSPRYAFLFQLDPADYKSWANGLRQAGYATNYRYAQILIKLIDDYNLEQYSLIAMGKLPADRETMVALARSGDSTAPAILIHAVRPSARFAEERGLTAPLPSAPVYPATEFRINNAAVLYAMAGTSLLSLAEDHHLSFARILDFNDLDDGGVLPAGQLVFVQRKRKEGASPFHLVLPGETIYSICQSEGIRKASLLDYNLLKPGMEPAAGEKLYLRETAAARPLLADEKRLVITEIATQPPALVTAAPEKHIVQSKETLYSISRKYGVSLDDLKSFNRLDSMEVRVGQQLAIPRQGK